jgi:hypothetical protein
MKRRIRSLSVMAGLMFAMYLGVGLKLQTAAAGGPSVDAVLGIDQPDCCHVIDLLARNRARRFAGHAQPVGIDVLGGLPTPGDLELLEVNLVCDAVVGQGAVGQGPVFQVSFRNTSQCAVQDFQISVVGVLERISVHSPCRSIRVPCINAGETKCIEIQLPARCMTLGLRGGPLTPFDTLVVALDSFDELVECNELNNVAIVRRAEIPVLAAAAPAIAVAPVTIDPGTTAPADGTVPAPAPTAPTDETIPSPLENIDLDKLDLDDAQETAVRVS